MKRRDDSWRIIPRWVNHGFAWALAGTFVIYVVSVMGFRDGLEAIAWLGAIIGFFGLVVIGFFGFVDDVKASFNPNREVHHYHRLTIDREGNLVESTEYTEEK